MADQDRRAQRVRRDVPVAFRVLLHVALCVLAAALVSAPLALERGVERTQIRDTIGLVPATLSLTGTSESELRLGILGTIRVPLSKGPLGVSVTADGAPETPAGDGGVSSYFSPQMLAVYGGLFHDPARAVDGYVEQLQDALLRQALDTELLYAALGGAALLLLLRVADPRLRRWLTRRPVVSAVAGLALGLGVSSAVAFAEFREWAAAVPDATAPVYPLPSLDGTPAAGAVTDSPVLRLAIEDALPKVETLIHRQETRTDAYVRKATRELDRSAALMTGPRAGEDMVMMQSDMHCNAAMISLQRHVVGLLDHRHGSGAVSLLAITGDLTTNGTAAEGGCIADEAAIAGDAPVAAVTGNHESATSTRQMAAAGMTVLTGSTEKLAGTKVLGAGDPNRTQLFGSTAPRGDATETSVGGEVYAAARHDRPDLVLLHEAYAVQAFLGSGVQDMRAFLDGRGSATTWWDDGIRDLPAAAVLYGHWHRGVVPRVVWNSDGSWTLVMELNTSGGAIASPTLNHFSTPWSTPQQPAEFPVVFEDRSTHLVTGYQLYRFATDGTVTVLPRVDVGSPGGRPVPPDRRSALGAQ
ncbi:MAG: metallophosphoesterase family protein [Nocardioides sp.]